MRERNANTDAIAGMLPLLPATFHILVALADEDRHGYAIIQDVAARTDGSIRLSPGTLYRSVQRMLEDGLIVETDERPSPEDDDERRRLWCPLRCPGVRDKLLRPRTWSTPRRTARAARPG